MDTKSAKSVCEFVLWQTSTATYRIGYCSGKFIIKIWIFETFLFNLQVYDQLQRNSNFQFLDYN